MNICETKQRIKNIVLSDPHAASCCGRDLLVSSSLRGWRLSSIAGQRDCRSRLAPIPKPPLQWYQVLQVSSHGESAFAILQGSRCVKVHRKPMQSILQGSPSPYPSPTPETSNVKKCLPTEAVSSPTRRSFFLQGVSEPVSSP